jgi:hypothetical protein
MTTQLASARAAAKETPPQTLDTLPGSGGLADDGALLRNLHSEVVGWLTTVMQFFWGAIQPVGLTCGQMTKEG